MSVKLQSRSVQLEPNEAIGAWFGSEGAGTAAWHAAIADSLTESLAAIGRTGMAVAAILGIVLDNLVPGSRQERGLPEPPGILTPEAGDL